MAEFAYNNSPHTSTGVTPFYANYGFEPTTPISMHSPEDSSSEASKYLQNIKDTWDYITQQVEHSKQLQAEQANKTRRDLQFKVGDKVKLDTSDLKMADQPSRKLRDRYIGPLTVSKVITPVAYKLQLPISMSRVHPVFHISKLQPWREDAEHPNHVQQQKPIPAAKDYISGDDVFEVDHIYDVKIDEGKTRGGDTLYFRVHWAFPYNTQDQDSWEPYDGVKRLNALKDFFTKERWQQFKESVEYQRFARKYPKKVPSAR